LIAATRADEPDTPLEPGDGDLVVPPDAVEQADSACPRMGPEGVNGSSMGGADAREGIGGYHLVVSAADPPSTAAHAMRSS
jgi:hypothetical protein